MRRSCQEKSTGEQNERALIKAIVASHPNKALTRAAGCTRVRESKRSIVTFFLNRNEKEEHKLASGLFRSAHALALSTSGVLGPNTFTVRYECGVNLDSCEIEMSKINSFN